MTSRQLAAFFFLAFLWGSSFLYIKVLIGAGASPLAVAALRTGLGLAVLAPIAWRMRSGFPRDRRTLKWLGVLGILNFAAPWTLFGIGQQFTPSAAGSIVNATNPLWVAVIAVPVLADERLSPGRVAGLLAGFFGVVVLMIERVDGFDKESLLGIPPMLLATICYAASSVMIRRFVPGVPAVPLAAGQLAVAAAALIPLSLLTGGYSDAEFGWQEWASVVALGCAGSGFGTLIYMWLIRQVGAVRSAVVTYVMAPIGVILGWLVLDEAITWSLAVGLGLILAGVALVQFERAVWPERPGMRREETTKPQSSASRPS